AEGQTFLVTEVGKAVPDEPRLVLEGPEHALVGEVRELLEGALFDLVGFDANRLHVSLLARWCVVPTRGTNVACSRTGTRSGLSGHRWSQRMRPDGCEPRASISPDSYRGSHPLKRTSFTDRHDG